MERVASPHSLTLDENLTIAAVPSLVESLKSSENKPVSFDAGAVKHLDWPVVQLFLSSARDWRNKEQSFVFNNISENFQFGLDTLGIDLDAITSLETA
jgi:anti-anti-sigma regulatory factor